MTTEQTPREFWINEPTNRSDYFETFISKVDPRQLSEDDDYMYLKDKELICLVEKSAYDKAVAALQKLLKKTINYAESGLIDNYVMEDPDEMSLSDAVDLAELTLKELGEL